MSPTSYQTAPPRDNEVRILKTLFASVNPLREKLNGVVKYYAELGSGVNKHPDV
ncbi:hypothetical protein [Hahella sp. KA22]|uniref:hypothetical protein n=1 Tax=Hahella sp. KA22 TaxID=1628392 RepID=UPI0013E3A3BF|nr:hypothetical protein [Hahella sp. KA22]